MKQEACVHAARWILANRGRSALAALTGQDAAALAVVAHAAGLYAVGDVEGRRAAVSIIHAALGAMQLSTWSAARAALEAKLPAEDVEAISRAKP